MVELPCQRGAFHQPDEDIIERRQYLMEGNDLMLPGEQVLQHIVRAIAFIYF